MLHEIIHTLLPLFVEITEVIGILYLFIGYVYHFIKYIGAMASKKHYPINIFLGKVFSTSLSLLMAAEILKSIVISDVHDFYVLMGIVIIRVTLALLLHYEIKHEEEHEKEYLEHTHEVHE